MATHSSSAQPPLIVHLVYRFATGGLENGLSNLVNALPAQLARHHIIALVGVDQTFASRITSKNCTIENLGANANQQTLRLLPAVYRRLKALKPQLVHTRNVATLECQYAAWIARVPRRVHGEHGWDEADQYGRNRRYTRLRQLTKNVIHQQVALSSRTSDYLKETVGVAGHKLREIHNGVDTKRFEPASDRANDSKPGGWAFSQDNFVIGSVGRLSSVKNQRLMCLAFSALRQRHDHFRQKAKLVIVGDGPDRIQLQQLVAAEDMADAVWFAGDRSDIPQMLQQMDVFCLPSKAEGLSNSVLEAMATGLPIVATDVGGNSEQIDDGVSGLITPSEDANAMANAFEQVFDSTSMGERLGQAARKKAVSCFSLQSMVAEYQQLYTDMLSSASQTNQTFRTRAGNS
ncbi:MAG: glycosyltransferase [Burkholderiaceae bacterium]